MSGDARHMLPLFGKGQALGDIVAKLPPSARAGCEVTIQALLDAGFIARHVQTTDTAPVTATPVREAEEPDPTLDFTRRMPAFVPLIQPGAVPLLNDKAMLDEIEHRSQLLASEKISQFEQEMSNSLAQMAGYELFKVEQDKLSSQQAMVETARLSPIYETLRGLSFFSDFSDAELAEVLHIGVWRELAEHDVMLRDGEMAEAVYVLMSGHAGVFKRERLIGLIHGGESYGESAMLAGDDQMHHAEVIARSTLEVMGFSTALLARTSPELRLHFVTAFLRCQTRRLVCANEQIVNLLADET
jgi:hypothetical protein